MAHPSEAVKGLLVEIHFFKNKIFNKIFTGGFHSFLFACVVENCFQIV